MKDLTNYLRRKTASEEELQAADMIEKLREELKTAECNYACEMGDTQELREELATTQKLLEESRANDRTAMGYLTEIRGIVGGDDIPDMVARVAAEKKDADRYRWLREQHWSESKLCVVKEPSDAVKIGYSCPSLGMLDEEIDAAMKEQQS